MATISGGSLTTHVSPRHSSSKLILSVTTTTPQHLSCSATTLGPRRDVQDRATLICQRSREGQCREALDLFRDMAQDGHRVPDRFWSSLGAVIRCCTELGVVMNGKEVHGFVVRNQGTEMDRQCAESSLVRFYANCGLLQSARTVFDRMFKRDVVAWTIMLMACADLDGHEDEMWGLFQQMLCSGVAPNQYTVTTVLRRVTFDRGRQVHSQIVKRSWDSEVFVSSALIGMYARNGVLGSAKLVFDRIEEKDEVCFNSLISGYGRIAGGERLLATFVEMGLMGLSANQSTYVAILNGCANFGSSSLSRQFHAYVIRSGYASNCIVEAVLVDMYAKCGDLDAARAVFDRMSAEKSVFVWNSMIGGYGKHGYAERALEVFRLMELESVPPDYITFTCLLSACSHSGLVSEGWELFKLMTEAYEIPPRGEHYGCMVDLMGRAGMIREAYEFIHGIKDEVGASVWGALLSACRMWADVEIAEVSATRLFELEPDCSGSYVALAGMFTASGRQSDAVAVRGLMDARRVKKEAGNSWIEVDGEVHKFRAGKESLDHHPHVEDIQSICRGLNSCLRCTYSLDLSEGWDIC